MALGPGDKEQAEIPDEIDPRWAALLQLRGDDDDSNSEESKRNGTASKTKSQQRPAQSPPLPRCHRRFQAGGVLQLPRPDDAASRCPTCGYYKGRQIIDVDAE
ncbi:MAG: hypothetical protein R2854_26045 [Caldilineaceae bacterium]